MSIVLSCQKLSKTYQDGKNKVPVLHQIDLSVKQNDSIAIVGASGSGKSTLLHLFGGLDQPSNGRVFWREKDIGQFSEAERCRQRNHHIGFVYQFHHLLPEFTAIENVALPLLIQGLKPAQALRRATEMLAAVSLAERQQHKIGELSGGERQRTAVARALVIEPSCVLADEPTGNLDQHTASQVLAVMLQLQQQLNTAFVIVTHDQQLASQLNHRYQLIDGQLSSQ